jgi:hypothetical protein
MRERGNSPRRAECSFRSPPGLPATLHDLSASHPLRLTPRTSPAGVTGRSGAGLSAALSSPEAYRSMISHQRNVPGFPIPDQSSFTTWRTIHTLIPGMQGNNTRPYLYPTRRRLARPGLSDQWAVFNLYEFCTCTTVWGNSERRVPEAANRRRPPLIVALMSSQSPRSRRWPSRLLDPLPRHPPKTQEG